MNMTRAIAVLGAGSWGIGLAMVLCGRGHQVTVWSNSEEELNHIARTRRLLHKLPDIILPPEILLESDPSVFMPQCTMLVIAVPSRFIRPFAQSFSPHICGKKKTVVCATKGLDHEHLTTMSQVLESIWLDQHDEIEGVVALSGPSHAEEVARSLPTAIVAAHENPALAASVQDAFQSPAFRVYTNTDRTGVEIGGALKNVMAIAAGISDGLGFGDNARAALISRGLNEISMAGKALGAQPETFAGLSGLGDLVVTCTSRHSRNHRFGEMLARGYSTVDALEEIGMAVEGVTTVQAIPSMEKRLNTELPISHEVYRTVVEGADPRASVEALMQRESKAE